MGRAAVVGFTTAATAATPVGVWDGFNSMTSGDYTWTASAGTTVEEGVVTIGSDGGLTMADPTGLGDKAVTFIADIEGFDPDGAQMTIFDIGLGANRVNISSRPSDNNVYQLWNANNGYGNVGTISTGKVRIIMTYSAGSGTTTYVVGGNTASSGDLKSSDAAIASLGIGCYNGTERVAAGMKVYRLAMFNRKLSEDESKAYLFPSEKPKHDYESVLSLNFGASDYDVPADTDPGACVDDSNWYNFSGAGTGTAGDVTVTRTTSGNYQNTGKSAQYLKGYLDDYSDNKTAVTVSISDLETAPYDVYIYCSSDNATGWSCKTVNGVAYTADATGKGVAGTSTWGNNSNLSEVLGKNVMVVENVYPDAESKITIASVRNSGYRGCIAAIQVCQKPAAPTYEAEIDEETDWKDIEWDPSKPEGGFEDDAVLKLKVNGETTLTFSEILNIPQRLEINDDGENALTLKAADALFTDGCYEKTIATFGSFVPGCAEVSEELPAGFSGAYTLTDSGFKVRAQNREVISINIGGGNGSGDSPAANLVPADQNYYGLAPVKGETWNNISKQWQGGWQTITLVGSKAAQADGTLVDRPTIDLSAGAKNTWSWSCTDAYLTGYLDDGSGVDVSVHGVPYTKYDVIVYGTSDDARWGIAPVEINGTKYTCGADGIGYEGETGWGVGQTKTAQFGKNAMYVSGLSGEELSIKATRLNGQHRGTLCAVQVICQGDIEIRHEYYGEMSGDVVWTDGEEDENLEKLGDSWENGSLNTITITNTAADATFSFAQNTEGQQIKFVSDEDCALTIDAKSMVEYGKLGIYDFTEAAGGVTIKLPEDEAFDVSTLPTTIKGDWKFSKDGILVFDGKLPPDSYKTFFTNETDWAGTVWIKNYAVSGQVFNEYGNANSKLRFTGVKGWFNYNTNETTLPIELVDEGDTLALEVTDGSLNKSYIFDKITGDGSINVSSVHDDAFIVQIKDVSEYYGKITSLASTTPKGDETKPFPILIGEMEGALPYGTTSKITVADGAAINPDCGWEAESVAFGATLMLMSGAEGGQIVSGLEMEEPVYLATKVMYPEESNPDFSCLGYEDEGIWIRKAAEFSIDPGENATVTTVLGAFKEGDSYYAANEAPVQVTFTANDGYIFPNGSKTLTDDAEAGEGATIEPTEQPVAAGAKIGDVYYLTLQEALNVGGDVVMLKDATAEVTVPAGKTVNLDFNGFAITTASRQAINNYGTLTIENGNITAQEAAIVLWGNSVTTINGGDYTANDNAVIMGSGNEGEGNVTLTITDGTFNGTIESAGYIACGIYVPNSGTYTISGGTFNITGGCGICARAGEIKVASDAEFNLGFPTEPGKVGDSKRLVPCVAMYTDYEAAYPGHAETDYLKAQDNTLSTADTQTWSGPDEEGYYTLVAKTPGPTPAPGSDVKVDPVPGQDNTYYVNPTGEATALTIQNVKDGDTLIITNTTVTSLAVDNNNATIKVMNKDGEVDITSVVYGWDPVPENTTAMMKKIKTSSAAANETGTFSTLLDPAKVNLAVTGITPGATTEIGVTTVVGLTYTLIRQTELGGEETPLTPVVATETATTLADDAAPAGQAFYKVQATK